MRLPGTRLAPVGAPIALADAWRGMRAPDLARSLRAGLAAQLGAEHVSFYRSGREALRVALRALAEARGRDEVVVPAYTCYSVPAAAVAAGLRVRLADVTPRGALDPAALSALPLERVAAVVVCNLLGVPEPVAALQQIATDAGAALVDDAAQSLGAQLAGKPVGGRGAVGVLSFGRGKPLSGLGGGALAWSGRTEATPEPTPGHPDVLRATTRLLAYTIARQPGVFRWLSAIPALGIGETVYEPRFTRGGIDGAALQLTAMAFGALENANAARAARASRLGEAIAEHSRYEPLLAEPDSRPAYPRLGVLAPHREARDAALARLGQLGAARLYPRSLDRLEALAPHRCSGDPPHEAARLADRLLTLPTHDQLGERQADEVVAKLATLA